VVVNPEGGPQWRFWQGFMAVCAPLDLTQAARLARASLEPASPLPRFSHMRVREEDRNMVLLAAVTLVSVVVAGVAALFEPVTAKQETASTPAYLIDSTPVRVVGAPFVPNTNPRERH
jgi:uncharacterized membrane protein